MNMFFNRAKIGFLPEITETPAACKYKTLPRAVCHSRILPLSGTGVC